MNDVTKNVPFTRILMDQGICFLVVSLMLIRGHAIANRAIVRAA